SRRDPLLIDRLSTLPPLLPLDPRAERSPPRARPRSGGRPRREQLSPLAVARPAPPVPAFRAREARDRAFRERFPRQSARAIPALLDGFPAALSRGLSRLRPHHPRARSRLLGVRPRPRRRTHAHRRREAVVSPPRSLRDRAGPRVLRP